MKKYVDKCISLVQKLSENQNLMLPIACLFLGIIIGFWISPVKNGVSIWCDNTVGSNNGNCRNEGFKLNNTREKYKNK